MALLPPTYIRTCIITICVSVYLHAERHAWDMPCLFWMESAVYGNAGQGGSKGGEGCILGGGCMHEGAGLAGSWDGKALTGFFACILPKRPILLTSMAGWILIIMGFARSGYICLFCFYSLSKTRAIGPKGMMNSKLYFESTRHSSVFFSFTSAMIPTLSLLIRSFILRVLRVARLPHLGLHSVELEYFEIC